MSKMIGCTNRSHPTSAAIVAAVLALILVQARAFHQLAALRQNRAIRSPSPARGFSTTTTTAPTSRRPLAMSSEYQPPWPHQQASEDSGVEGSLRAASTALGAAAPFSLPMVLEECPLCILDPDVRETDKGYALTFNLPAEVTEDGLDVSVSGRLLTIEARVTREDNHKIVSKPAGSRCSGWVITRPASRTHAATRSFTLPDGVSNQVTAYWVANDVVEIHLAKEAASDLTTPEEDYHDHLPHHAAYYPASSASSTMNGGTKNDSPSSSSSAMEDSGGVPVEHRCDEENKPSTPSSGTEAPKRPAQQQHQQRRSLLAALDDEFRDLVKTMWTGDDAVRFPTEEQVAATVERAREERKKRVTALRRATMATSVSENDLAYAVTVALPNGATRDDVKLMVTPDNNGLRVTFSAEGQRTMSKAVRLPWDALFEDISATFTPEMATASESGAPAEVSATNESGRADRGRRARATVSRNKKKKCGGVSSLEVTVGRVPPQLPKSIEIK